MDQEASETGGATAVAAEDVAAAALAEPAAAPELLPPPAVRWPLARRARAFGPSLWAEVGAYLDRHPDPVFFGSGAPAPELTPLDRLRAAAAEVWADAAGNLGYAEATGYEPLRQLVAARMADRGAAVDPAQVLITNGSQQGIDLVARLLLDPGDAVVVEGPTYLGALTVFEAAEATYVVVPMDDEGLDVAALGSALADRAARGLPAPKLLYTVPTFQNPTGGTMSDARRRAVLALARRHNLLVVEDDPYGELRYDGEPIATLRALDPDVVYLGTFSKTIAPGLRVGWLVAPTELVDPLTNAREAADIHGERMTARIVHRTADGFLDGHLVAARAVYRRRRDALLRCLERHLPAGTTWQAPTGGFFVWVELPQGLDAAALLPAAADRGVVYMPGGWFYPDRRADRGLRLSFSTLDEATIARGTERLGAVVAEALGGMAGDTPGPR